MLALAEQAGSVAVRVCARQLCAPPSSLPHTNSAQLGSLHAPPPHTRAQEEECVLQRELLAAQQRVHESLCDNVNTQAAMGALCDLVKASNVYLAWRQDAAGGSRGAGRSDEGLVGANRDLGASVQLGILGAHWGAAVSGWSVVRRPSSRCDS